MITIATVIVTVYAIAAAIVTVTAVAVIADDVTTAVVTGIAVTVSVSAAIIAAAVAAAAATAAAAAGGGGETTVTLWNMFGFDIFCANGREMVSDEAVKQLRSCTGAFGRSGLRCGLGTWRLVGVGILELCNTHVFVLEQIPKLGPG